MNIHKEKIIGEIVAADFHTAAIFEKFGLDYCCKGNRTLAKACMEAGIDPDLVIEALNQPEQAENKSIDYKEWPVDLLADYIEKKHHRYVNDTLPALRSYLEKVTEAHGNRHPELIEVLQLFIESSHELRAHMKKEEMILFPYIRKMMQTKLAGEAFSSVPFGTVQNPISMMVHEHDMEGERFRRIAELTNEFTPPADACNTYVVMLSLLKEFKEDLHLHIHLENNILFPKSIALESDIHR